MEFNGKTITKKKIILDGNVFIDCDISECVLVYRGGRLPALRDCRINDCQWSFTNSAANTLQFMSAMYNGMGAGGMDLIDKTIANIRDNKLTAASANDEKSEAEPAEESEPAQKAS